MTLGALAYALALGSGITLGAWAAVRHNPGGRPADQPRLASRHLHPELRPGADAGHALRHPAQRPSLLRLGLARPDHPARRPASPSPSPPPSRGSPAAASSKSSGSTSSAPRGPKAFPRTRSFSGTPSRSPSCPSSATAAGRGRHPHRLDRDRDPLRHPRASASSSSTARSTAIPS